jgi:hypothetical protein
MAKAVGIEAGTTDTAAAAVMEGASAGVVPNAAVGRVPDRTVLDVARAGDASADRVLRSAQVVVSRRSEQEEGEG